MLAFSDIVKACIWDGWIDWWNIHYLSVLTAKQGDFIVTFDATYLLDKSETNLQTSSIEYSTKASKTTEYYIISV